MAGNTQTDANGLANDTQTIQPTGMKVRKVRYPTGRVKWCSDFGTVAGKRLQTFHDKRDDAIAALEAAKHEEKRHGFTALAMTHEQRLRYATAETQLAAVGATIEEAISYYIAHRAKVVSPALVADVVKRCQDAKAANGRRPQYVRMLGVAGRALADWLPSGTMAHDVTAGMVGDFMASRSLAPKTAINWLADLHTVWAWAMQKGHASVDPTQGIERPSKTDGEIDFLRVDEVARVLSMVQEKEPELLGFHILGIFAGIRPQELARMKWDDVRPEESSAIVSGETSKTRQRRVVELEPAAVKWLATCERRADGKICGPRIEVRLAALRVDFALGREWPHDAMRHTYATFHYAHFRDERKLQANMGHRSSALLYTNYRALASAADAARFWKLTPAEVASTKLL